MITPGSIESLFDKNSFRQKRQEAWQRNTSYWLANPLRHVVDVGEYIIDQAEKACLRSDRSQPVVVDMGCGSGWLLREFLMRRIRATYFGLDFSEKFIEHGRAEFINEEDAHFERADFELPVLQHFDADLVINAFNFFELCDLHEAFANASRFLRLGGTLQASTIDKTYLILAVSSGWADFFDKLKLYGELSGTKYTFQPIDLGNGVSETLLYPSVLYSTQDYIEAAQEHDLVLRSYQEHAFTSSYIPKIYCHFEFRKV